MINREVVAQLTASKPISQIIGQHVKLTRRGQMFFGLCPFHNERSGSFQVDDRFQNYRCHGCGAHGDAVDFVRQALGMSFRDAVSYIGGGSIPDAPNPARAAEFRARQSEMAAEQSRRTELDRDLAARRAQSLWESAEPCGDHPYLARKQVPAFGLRVGDYYRNIDGRTVKIATSLFVPLYSAPRCMVNLQVIMADKSNPLGRDKDFLPGGQIDGAYGVIPGARNRIAICEGYATGAAIALATGRYVALAMSAGNLMAIAVMVRARCPDADVVVCADNDAWTVKRFASGDVAWNPGVELGGAAAEAIGARLAVPRFVTAVRGQTDFNDLMIAEGKDIVRRQIDLA